ncbi:rab GTPase activator, putative [Plasmodium knowlesi strain H]|uniref:Rab GTPase activator, putative n=3 Tax=Plasmodium knowlesi TaxID=5850 RepID=A0A5K1UZD7_PLAKH|nr:rab GTPase activator, putative [Plasmodium knowlesi strain H]OTN65580.1 putative Rab GTPase activator [Plasmodium knowlesi]CAA9989459.1 rab GTPase activator, putative [Plasmodium knowlesi strain H]SBO25103.1 rab GTPase activator, putative [Plasmodium knowlesi strain H]SBO27814.1 rab GTPase activator, putative [Plasmodium knowlesi strain H]VVS78933.1 rab GTPase activator, putative [Plasmodium knowlesi strain H]|eukprot:XP_002260185.1 TLD domain containing protein, putative [Plasmodium knowlesi strain H]
MKKIYRGTKTDEIFQAQKNKYNHLINKNHIYNNIYLNLEVYEKWRNPNTDKDEHSHWNEKSLSLVLNADSNLMDKEVKHLLRRGVSDSLKHLIWVRSNDVNYFVINFPHFYETTIYNTFGDKIPSILFNDCPTFCGGILGLQEDIMCVQTKIEELEIENHEDYDNFNINDSTSNILQLLFNNPNENEKKKDQYLLPEHNFWIEPKTLSTPNFGFTNKKKKKKFFYIENVKNKLLRSKRIDNYLRVASDSVLPYSSNFIFKNLSNRFYKGKVEKFDDKTAEEADGEKLEHNTTSDNLNKGDISTAGGGDVNAHHAGNIGVSDRSAEGKENVKEEAGKNIDNLSTNGEKIHNESGFKLSNCSESEKNILIKDDIIIFHNGGDDTNSGPDYDTGRPENEKGEATHYSKGGTNYENMGGIHPSKIIGTNSHGDQSISANTKDNLLSTKMEGKDSNKEAYESNKYLHIQYYMTEQYIISKKQAEKMNKAKLYLRTTRKKKIEKELNYHNGKTKSHYDGNLHHGGIQNSDDSFANGVSGEEERMYGRGAGDDSSTYRLKKYSSYNGTRNFLKKAFSVKRANQKNERKLSDHISSLIKRSLIKDKEKNNIIPQWEILPVGSGSSGKEKSKKKKNEGVSRDDICMDGWSSSKSVGQNDPPSDKLQLNCREGDRARSPNSGSGGSARTCLQAESSSSDDGIERKREDHTYDPRLRKPQGNDEDEDEDDGESIVKLSEFNEEDMENKRTDTLDVSRKYMNHRVVDLDKKNNDGGKKSLFGKLKKIFYKKKKSKDSETDMMKFANVYRSEGDHRRQGGKKKKNFDTGNVYEDGTEEEDGEGRIKTEKKHTRSGDRGSIFSSSLNNTGMVTQYNTFTSIRESGLLERNRHHESLSPGRIETVGRSRKKNYRIIISKHEKKDHVQGQTDGVRKKEDKKQTFFSRIGKMSPPLGLSFEGATKLGEGTPGKKEPLSSSGMKRNLIKNPTRGMGTMREEADADELENFHLPASHPLNDEKSQVSDVSEGNESERRVGEKMKEKKKINFKCESREDAHAASGAENQENADPRKGSVYKEKNVSKTEMKGDASGKEVPRGKKIQEEQTNKMEKKYASVEYNSKDNPNLEKELYNKFYENGVTNTNGVNGANGANGVNSSNAVRSANPGNHNIGGGAGGTYPPNVYNLDDATELTALLNDNGKHEIKKLLWAINNNFGNDIEFAPIIPNLCIILLIYFKASVVYCIIHCLIKKGIDTMKNKEVPFFIYKRKDFVKYVKYILNSFIQFLPKCYHYLRTLNFDLAAWTARCIQDGFSRMLPFDFVLRIYGIYIFEGQKTLCLYCLALLKFFENDLLKCTNIEQVENILYHICMHPYLTINELTQIAYRFKLKSKEKQLKFSTKCPSPYLMNVKMKTFYRPRLNDNSRLINSLHWQNIWEKIPSNLRSLDPFLTYCSKKDGYSFQVLVERTEKNKRKPMILILKTFDYDLVGFFCPFSLTRDLNFVNCSDKSSAFLCTFNTHFKFYKWSGRNNTLVLIRDGIYIGGNDIALFIDKDVKVGKTHSSESFFSPPLISTGRDFHIMDIEVWNLK